MKVKPDLRLTIGAGLLFVIGFAVPSAAQTAGPELGTPGQQLGLLQTNTLLQQSISGYGQGMVQIGNSIVPVNTGPAPETGIHAGGFMVYPTLDTAGQFNDNVFAVNAGAKSDYSLDLHPGVYVASTWTNFLLGFNAQYDWHAYDRYTSQNTTNYLFNVEAKADLGERSQIDLVSEYDRLDELPGNTNITANAAEPTTYFRWNNTADFVKEFSAFQLGLGGFYTTFRFEDTPAVGGGIIDEEQRNRDNAGGYVDLAYSLTQSYQIFARGTYNTRDYTETVSDFRNSTGYEADAGVRTALTSLISGEAYLGYISQDYKGFSTVSGADYGLQLNWNVTPLDTVVANTSRSIQEADEVGASSYFETDAALGLNHSLSHTVMLNLQFLYTNNDYQGVPRQENIYSVGAGADYELTPHFHLAAQYRYSTRSSNIAVSDYSQNLIEIRARLAI
jgi:hypothetical protein